MAAPPVAAPADTAARVLTIPADGADLYVEVRGTGPAVVVLHGWAAQWRATQWAALLDTLTAAHTVVGVDVRGHGRSGKPHDASLYGRMLVDDVVRVLDGLGLERADLVGYSMGGIIALRAAASHPARIRSVTLIGQGLTPLATLESMAEGARALATVDTTTLSPEAMEGYRRNDVLALSALGSSYPELAVSDDEVRSLTMPVLMVVGSEDPRLERAEALKRLLPTAELRVLEGRTHGSVIDDPAYASAIARFLERVEERW